MTGSTIEDLARAADDAGAALVEEVGTLGDRLAPRRLVDEALGAVKTRGVGLARDAGTMVKAHPVVAAAAVAAVGLALYAGKKVANAELDLDHDLDGYTDYDDGLAEASTPAADLAEGAREAVSDNPVVAILAGLAAGVALALLFPSSSAEKRSLGTLARRLTRS
ncbi:hypothetical protein [Sandarakinorhabdus rubra]|uniref:hypothetical protein n=1 Tax=Sandarakinorhabdus rubra TaxID=2672568 RepID=UPI0013DB3519|nr:hypothetical protein [Sandarakinorhabdus rubra]